ncbi:MAG: cell division protein FtsZ [Acholeplasmatales bacterium]|jgi:cell division protein FtsZ|nr:cell division protein FtsZ [Acholeplasmatales bacterium]
MFEDITINNKNNFDLDADPVVKVIGVGGAGCNCINNLVHYDNDKYVKYISMNTDVKVLKKSNADVVLQLGRKLTRGLGAGAIPQIGENSALESKEEIRQILEGTDLIFLIAGMGGGTGTGAAPIVAQMARELGILVIAVVTKPFNWEQKSRMKEAILGIEKLKPHVDTLIVISNQKLMNVAKADSYALNTYEIVDDTVRLAVKGITDIVYQTGHINVDFADVRTVIQNKGFALMGIGTASGPNRAVEAVRKALESKLLEITIEGATDLIVMVTLPVKGEFFDIATVATEINNMVGEIAGRIIFGTSYISEKNEDEITVTIVATGYELAAEKAGIDDFLKDALNNTGESQLSFGSGSLKKKEDLSTNNFDDKSGNLPPWLRKK